MTAADSNIRPDPDSEIVRIADYVQNFRAADSLALQTARHCVMDSVGCAMLAYNFPACVRHLGPIVPGAEVANGARVLGSAFQLDPVKAAFDNGALIRWLDFNDTWLAAEWGHPSDNLGAIFSVADYLSRRDNHQPLTLGDVIQAAIKAHEIQGVLALENAFNRVGLDHVILVKVASAAVAANLLGGGREEIISAISHAFADGHSLRTYRHAPNTGPRKSWAAGDAASRAVRLAMMAVGGEPGLPSVLSSPKWGFCDALFRGKNLSVAREFGSYVMENILFKIAYPAEFHAQTAVECALQLHPQVKNRLDDIARIEIGTQESAVRIISKTGPLHNPADRDHCLQYMIAVPLIFGELTAAHYEDGIAADPRIDNLRGKMEVHENKRYSEDYLRPDIRSIANSVQVIFCDGTATEKVEVEFPLGHRRRRDEGIPLLEKKFLAALKSRLPESRAEKIFALCQNADAFDATSVPEFTDLLAV